MLIFHVVYVLNASYNCELNVSSDVDTIFSVVGGEGEVQNSWLKNVYLGKKCW